MSANKAQPSMGCGYVVFFILLAGGLALLGLGWSHLQANEGRMTVEAALSGAIGLMLVAGALGYLRLARREVAKAAAAAARRAEFPNQPWKWREEWVGPAIEAKAGRTTGFFWFFTIFWNAIAIPAVVMVILEQPDEKGAYFVFLFPLVGLGLLWGAIYQTVRLRKYGRIRFVPTALPGVIGGYLGGVIEVPARVVPESDGRLALKCMRRETRGSGKNRRTTENILWEREEVIPRDKWMTGTGGTRIPVLFYIPPGQPDSDDRDSNNEVVWRLTASAATVGVDFATALEVPVFATGETAVPPDPTAPVLEEYQAQALDGAALAASGVRREGDTFHFSASHLPGMRFTSAALLVGLLGLLGWFCTIDAPGVAWAVTLFFGAIIALVAAGVWFDRVELRVERDDVVVTKPRPWGTKVTRVPRRAVARIELRKTMSSGEKQYFGLDLVGEAGVDPAGPAGEGEAFGLRKLRYQLAQVEKGGAGSRDEIVAQLQQHPRFTVPFAQHIPGQGRAKQIAALVLAAVHRT